MPLNPNAKEFSFNPAASEFVPGNFNFSFTPAVSAAPFVPAAEPSKALPKDAEPFVPKSAAASVAQGAASASSASGALSGSKETKSEESKESGNAETKEGKPAAKADAKAEVKTDAKVETKAETTPAAVQPAAPAPATPAAPPARTWASLAAKKPDPEPPKVAAPVANGAEKQAEKPAAEVPKKAAPEPAAAQPAKPAPAAAPVAQASSSAPAPQTTPPTFSQTLSQKPANAAAPAPAAPAVPAQPTAASVVAQAAAAPAPVPTPAPAAAPTLAQVAAAPPPADAASKRKKEVAAAPATAEVRRGARYDLKVLLSIRERATPLEVLKSQSEDVRKCLEEETEHTSALFDFDKELTKTSLPGDGGRGGMRRQNSDGSMRKGNRKNNNNNNEPLRDKQGRIIEIKALEMTENRWKPSKPTDDEEKVYKTAKGLLNKLTLEKFDSVYDQIKAVGITTASLLRGFVVLLYDKAVVEPTFIGIYARMCEKLAADLPQVEDDQGVLPFAEVLVGKCRAEFAQMGKEEGLEGLSADEREQKLRKLRQRTLGNVEFIGELYNRRMVGADEVKLSIGKLTEEAKADTDKIQPLCKLLEGVGKDVEAESKAIIDETFASIDGILGNEGLSSRYRFMLLDLKDLRSNGWVPRRAASGPKTLEEVQKEVDKENRYTEKKKKDKEVDKPSKKAERGEKRGGKGKDGKKEAAKAEDEGWSQVTTEKQKGKQTKKPDRKHAKEEPLPSPVPASPSKAGSKAPTPKGGIPAARTGFAALMGDDDEEEEEDDDEDDDDKEAEDDDEEEEEEGDEGEAPELSDEAAGKVGSILEEFMCIHDVDEASQCIVELHEKGFPKGLLNEEIVHRGLLLALDAGEKECDLMGKMFGALLEQDVMAGDEGSRGFCKVLRDLPDIAIDIPKAPALLAGVVRELLVEQELLDRDIVAEGVRALREACAASGKHFDGVI